MDLVQLNENNTSNRIIIQCYNVLYAQPHKDRGCVITMVNGDRIHVDMSYSRLFGYL